MPLSLTEYLILGFAAYRGSRAVALDSITEPFRDWLSYRWGGRGSWRGKAVEFISCGWCAGFWVSAITYGVFINATGRANDASIPLHFLLWWAVAGLQSLLIGIDSFLLREAPSK